MTTSDEVVYRYLESGATLYEVVRKPPKQFTQRVPLGNGLYNYKLNGVRRVPYNLDDLLKRKARDAVLVVEGEKDADALHDRGFCATTNAGGCSWTWSPEFVEHFRGAKCVVVIPDCDEGDPTNGTRKGREAARDRATLLRTVVDDVRIMDLAPERHDGYDVSDFFAEGGNARELHSLIESSPRVELPIPDENGRADVQPLLADALARVAAFVREYVVVSEHQLTTLALWVAHTHAFGAAQTTPYVAITSVEMGSGKTRLLETLELLVRSPWMTARATAAALVRKVDRDAPTLLFDELDATFKGDEEKAEATRGILNSGYNSEGRATVCVGQGANIETRDLRTFCPKALAGIGKLPDTVRDRSVVIELRRKIAGEEASRFSRRYVKPQSAPIRDALAAWASAAIDELAASDPSIPDGISDRAADCWEPLLAIADLAGGDWPKRGREAAAALSGSGSDAAEDLTHGVRLLSDIRNAFDDEGDDRLSSATLAVKLSEIEESPWGPERGRPFDARALARKLAPYRIRPIKMRLGDATARGYERSQFEDSWKRYTPAKTRRFGTAEIEPAPAEVDFDRNSRNNPVITGFSGDLSTGTESSCSGPEMGRERLYMNDVPVVPDKIGLSGRGANNDAPTSPEIADVRRFNEAKI